MKKRRNEKLLRPVHPNAGLAAEYRRRLDRMILYMARSYQHWIRAQYRATPPRIAQDASPARELERQITELGKRWERNWQEGADRLADWFARSAKARSERTLL